MAPNRTNLFDLEAIRERRLSDLENNILNAFAYGMQSATQNLAIETAHYLDVFCPPVDQEKELHEYLWKIWELIFDIAQSPDVTAEIQQRLVSVVETVRECSKGEINIHGVCAMDTS